MSQLVSRRAVARLALLATAGALLSACGKKGSPLPPPETSGSRPSVYPRTYPAPSSYPNPGQAGGTTVQNPPPERQQPSADGINDGSGNTGTNGQ